MANLSNLNWTLTKWGNSELTGTSCTNWCKEQVELFVKDTETQGLKVIAISLLTITVTSLISDHSEKVSQWTQIKEETLMKIASYIFDFTQTFMAIALIYFYFFT